MKSADIARHRLHNQHLTGAPLKSPVEVVKWLGAVQAQDYPGAKWALAQRTPGVTDAAIDQVFAEGAILRTHVLRPTWHFVSPEDIRWMLELTAPRVHAVNATMYRQTGLDNATLRRCHTVLEKSLAGGKQLTRTELQVALEQAGISTKGDFRIGYIMGHAELDGLICSGGRRGKQFTYALLEERAPLARTLDRQAAVAELTRRYFTSHGPATLQDFAVWSGLTIKDARQGVEEVGSKLEHEELDGKTYWFPATRPPAKKASPTAHLLPNYDEYFIGFKDRSAISKAANAFKIHEATRRYALAAHIIFIDGQVVGGWKRALKKEVAVLEMTPIVQLTKADQQAVNRAAEKYGAFLELAVEMHWQKKPARG
jgi:hypothetical protein